MTALCQCGCGQPAPIATGNHARYGYVKGQPVRYIRHHFSPQRKNIDAMYVVDPAGCWVWQGNIESGYGRIGNRLAYRVFYERVRGKTAPGLQLDHVCRNRACVNPDHLEPVTRTENVRRGAQTRLSVGDVREIHALLSAGAPSTEIAERYGIARSHVRNIARGSHWRDVYAEVQGKRQFHRD